MKLRAASEADVPALAHVAERSYRSAFADILEEEVLTRRDAAFFAMRFAETWDRLVVAEDEGNPIGFLLVTDNHIDMLFVDPPAIGMGAGSRLLQFAEQNGARTLECFRHNHAARRFYERHGWRLEREYDRDFAGRSRSFVFYMKDEREA